MIRTRLWRVTDSLMNIRIVKRPNGEAPENIRDAWIGLLLPVLRRYAHTIQRRGYAVDPAAAVRLLANVNPAAARWWRTNEPHLFEPGRAFFFDEECCIAESCAEAGKHSKFVRSRILQLAVVALILTMILAAVAVMRTPVGMQRAHDLQRTHERAAFYMWAISTAAACAFLLCSAVMGKERITGLVRSWIFKIFAAFGQR